MLEELALVGGIAVKSSVAVMLAATGETLAEKSGVLNLGVEGMMLLGALAAFAVGVETQSAWLACGAGMLAGGALAGMHALFAIGLGAHQVLSGVALTLLGMGLSNFLGDPWLGKRGLRLGAHPVPGLADVPVLGDLFFRQHALWHVAVALTVGTWLLLSRTRWGLCIRACGEDAAAADAAGVAVRRTRTLCVLAGGLLAGLGGAYLSLVYVPGWKEGMTGGQGWIAIAMVIFAGWRPLVAAAGAVFFGAVTAAQFYVQVEGIQAVSPSFLRMLPYLLTIAVLTLSGLLPVRGGADRDGRGGRRRGSAPADLGRPFARR